MMLSLNRATILGNATRDAEIRYTPNGQAVASFGVATNRRFTTKDGNVQEDTQYHDIVAWAKLAEIADQIVKRGRRIYVEGRLRTRQWQGQDGTQRQRTEIIAENLIVMTPRGETRQEIIKEPKEEPPTPKAELSSGKAEEEKTETPKSEEKQSPSKKSTSDKKEKKEESGEEISLDEIPF